MLPKELITEVILLLDDKDYYNSRQVSKQFLLPDFLHKLRSNYQECVNRSKVDFILKYHFTEKTYLYACEVGNLEIVQKLQLCFKKLKLKALTTALASNQLAIVEWIFTLESELINYDTNREEINLLSKYYPRKLKFLFFERGMFVFV